MNAVPKKNLTKDIVGRIAGELSVIDRLQSERVSKFWKASIKNWGWTEQRKLDRRTVFEGVPPEMFTFDRFEQNVYDRAFWTKEDGQTDCHLVSLFHRVGPSLKELDLESFGSRHRPFIREIAVSLRLLPKLEVLNIRGFNLASFVEFLPSTLRVLKVSERLSVRTLETLSEKCPNLEEVPFTLLDGINSDILNTFIGRFPRQKRLVLPYLPTSVRNIKQIGQLRELEVLELSGFDEATLEAVATGCPNIRKLALYYRLPLTDVSLFRLGEMPKLTVLEIYGDYFGHGIVGADAFTDGVLKAVARRGQLKKLIAQKCANVTDSSIEYLVDKCKSLVSLDLSGCPQITKRSFKAVIAEVSRRHPPPSMPTDPRDEGIFFYKSNWTDIHPREAGQMIVPWLSLYMLGTIDRDSREII